MLDYRLDMLNSDESDNKWDRGNGGLGIYGIYGNYRDGNSLITGIWKWFVTGGATGVSLLFKV